MEKRQQVKIMSPEQGTGTALPMGQLLEGWGDDRSLANNALPANVDVGQVPSDNAC